LKGRETFGAIDVDDHDSGNSAGCYSYVGIPPLPPPRGNLLGVSGRGLKPASHTRVLCGILAIATTGALTIADNRVQRKYVKAARRVR
jgi:hypothetical protein